ncbi:hypothetical protein H3H36_01280 [Duganella sp. FT3S]|uniref:Uncharacterized protein n=1 Tax=Rugamonas fusca TaxID=2758568 RepID=A0A7W2I585_9BURK|nr:hypothetical protein [Rugamonas fusca]MBA5603995.1 hypothetical protein [Rugamonas fusca]
MPDITIIAAALNSLKTATDIVKFLRESDLSLERAELKLKLADLVGALADTKLELVEVQDTLSEKDKRIVELEEAFQSKDAFVRHYDAYYVADNCGNPTGIPYCLRCWENDHKKRQLVHDARDHQTRVCTSCGHRYEGRMVGTIQPPPKAP